jgi:hypothetical protein
LNAFFYLKKALLNHPHPLPRQREKGAQMSQKMWVKIDACARMTLINNFGWKCSTIQ